MSLPVGTILKVVCTLVADDASLIQNVFGAVIGGSGGPFDEDDIVSDLTDWVDTMYGNLTGRIKSTIDPSEVKVYEYDAVDDDFDEVGTGVPTFVTSNTGATLPRGVAVLINAKTTDPDVNGKKYIGGLTEDAWGDGAWISAALADIADFATDWYTPFVGAASGATMAGGIWSPTNKNFYLLSGTFIVPVTANYQRRRRPGVGV
jgi:hypothetical protein